MQRNTIVLPKPEGMKIPKQKEITKDEGRKEQNYMQKPFKLQLYPVIRSSW